MFFRHRISGYKKIGKDFHFELDRRLSAQGRYKLINIPRNHYKTTQVLSWIQQRIAQNPNISVLYETSVAEDAKRSILEIRSAFESAAFRDIFGDWRGQPWEDWQFTVKTRTEFQAAPTLSASGLDRTQTGQHYDIIILDDLVDEHNHRTREGREKVKDRFRDAMSLLRPGGILIVIGTPWDPDDLYALIKKTPAIAAVFDIFTLDVYRKDGTLLMPDEFCETIEEEIASGGTKRSLEMLRIILGPLKFASQYRCNIEGVDLSEFRRGWLKHSPDEEVRKRMLDHRTRGQVVFLVDPALGRETSLKPCDAAIVGIHLMSNHTIDVFMVDAKPDDSGGTIERILENVQMFRPDDVYIEDVLFQATMLKELEYQRNLRGIRKFNISPAAPRGQGDKDKRIRQLFPYYRFGQIRHAESLRGSILEEQLIRFPKGDKRDVVDALSQFTWVLDFPSRPPKANAGLPEGVAASTMAWSQRAPKDRKRVREAVSQLGKEFLDVG